MLGLTHVGEFNIDYLYSSHPKNVQRTNPSIISQRFNYNSVYLYFLEIKFKKKIFII